MRLGLQIDLRNPIDERRPWADHYAHWLDRIAEADQLGCDAVWLPEHHLFEDGYLTQPLTFAAAIAMRTRRLRIGTAVLLAPLRPAILIAEEAALVDILSRGRLELGIGAGYRIPEYEAYGVDPGQRFQAVRRCLRELPRLLEEVSPPPVQRPMPLWLGTNTPRGARAAGRQGAGLLNAKQALLGPYLEGLEEGGRDRSQARMAAWAFSIVADDPEAVYDQIAPHYMYVVNSYRRYMVEGTGKPKPPLLPASAARTFQSSMLPALEVLTPDQTVARIESLTAGLPVSDMWFYADFGSMPAAIVDRHIELLFTAVRPALARVQPGSAAPR